MSRGFVLLVPGALAAGLGDALFWWSVARSRWHAVVHELHHAH